MMPTAYAFEVSPAHAIPDHPERPERLGLLGAKLGSLDALRLDSSVASPEDVMLVHSAGLLDSVSAACRRGPGIIDPAPTYVAKSSLEDAYRAVGGTLACLRAVLGGEVNNAFSIIRPPGHHAEPGRSMGFCIFNNVAIAAKAALAGGLQRVAIIDFDAHHGNGTQAAFLHDPRVAFLSTHQWGIYPGTGWFEQAPDARKRLVNVPLPALAGDRTFDRVAEEIIQPFVRAFRPELLLVSAGFDAHWNDPITSLGLSTRGFHELSRHLIGLADEFCSGRIVFVLEGGYDPANVAAGGQAVFDALMKRTFIDPQDPSPYGEPQAGERIAAVRAWHGY
jgi:acetoin utilization deacetylase AcuC-like enzyme